MGVGHVQIQLLTGAHRRAARLQQCAMAAEPGDHICVRLQIALSGRLSGARSAHKN